MVEITYEVGNNRNIGDKSQYWETEHEHQSAANQTKCNLIYASSMKRLLGADLLSFASGHCNIIPL